MTSDADGNLSFTKDISADSLSAPTVSATTLQAPYIKSTPTSATFTLPTAHGAAGSYLQDNGSGVLTFQSVIISLYGATNPTISTVANPGVVYMNTATYEYFVCAGTRVVSGVTRYLWVGSQNTYVGFPQGQQAYTAGSGTYTFVVPDGVYQISAVLVGGGGGGNGGGNGGGSSRAGCGGALAYATFPVTPGETLTVIVGSGGAQSTGGGASSIQRSGTVLFTAQGGLYNHTSTRALPVSGAITCYGGAGGLCSANGYGGGGGAGGYGATTDGSDARGGDGYYGSTVMGGTSGQNNGGGSNGAGGGGIGYQSSTYGFGGGGGVGLLGRGTNGAVNTTNSGNVFSASYGGNGGSGGEQGAGNTNTPQTLNGRTMYSGQGGRFGGGGGGSGTSLSSTSQFCNGGYGGARIIWGAGRAYPATNTADVTPSD